MSKTTKTIIIVISVILAAALIFTCSFFIVMKLLPNNNNNKLQNGSLNNITLSVFNKPTIYADNVEGRVGDIVTVPVYIVENPGIMAFIFEIDYDEDMLEYVSYSEGDIVKNFQLNNKDGEIKVLDIQNGDITKNGKLFDLKFKIISNEENDADIDIELEDGSFANYNEEFIHFEDKDAIVKIIK